ncbi:MAG: LytTR family DNA-binding domain-containing protein [Casimicrobiaceae bacterium]
MSALKAVIAEDEAELRAELKETLAAVWPELIICAEAEDGIQAMHAVSAHAPDILFLDIQMPGMTGLEIAQQVSGRCHVVFVTAYDKHAVAAFEQGAVDYVMKPFSPARLATTVARLKARVEHTPANLDGVLKALAARIEHGKEYLRWINASEGQNVRLITVEEICYFQADNKYTLVVTQDTQSLIRRSIKELVDEVDPNVFWQIHRSTLVNVNAIIGVNRDFKGHLRVRLKQRKETLSVSESYMHLFRQM